VPGACCQKDVSVASKPRFGCYSPARTGSAGQAPGGKVARWRGVKVVHICIDVLSPSGRLQPRKWESNLGMDPFSFGYNKATPLSKYMNTSTLITSLVDIVSKNGNFLLDVGPQPNGTILEVEQRTLREAGRWLGSHGEAIYNTTYWFVMPEEGNIRFTTTNDAFYICSLAAPRKNDITKFTDSIRGKRQRGCRRWRDAWKGRSIKIA
jgi:hypothetical protein